MVYSILYFQSIFSSRFGLYVVVLVRDDQSISIQEVVNDFDPIPSKKRHYLRQGSNSKSTPSKLQLETPGRFEVDPKLKRKLHPNSNLTKPHKEDSGKLLRNT